MWLCRTIARSPTRRESDTTDGEEVERVVQIALVLGMQPEVGCGDRRYEAVVERLRDPQRRVNAIPARAQGQLMHAELPRVEEPEDLDEGEVGLQKLAA